MMYNRREPELHRHILDHTKPITSLKFLNGDHIVSSSEDISIVQSCFETANLQGVRITCHSEAINELDCSRNEKIVVSASSDKTIGLWVPSLQGTDRIPAHTKRVTTVNIAHSGRQIISGAMDRYLKLWDMSTRKLIHTYTGHQQGINCVRFNEDDNMIISCGNANSLKLCDKRHQHMEDFIYIDQLNSTASKIAVYGNYLACAMQSGSVHVYDCKRRARVQHYVLNLHDECINDVAWHPQGQYLIAGSSSGTATIIDVLKGECLYKVDGSGDSITSVAFSPDGKYFALGGHNKQILIYKWSSC